MDQPPVWNREEEGDGRWDIRNVVCISQRSHQASGLIFTFLPRDHPACTTWRYQNLKLTLVCVGVNEELLLAPDVRTALHHMFHRYIARRDAFELRDISCESSWAQSHINAVIYSHFQYGYRPVTNSTWIFYHRSGCMSNTIARSQQLEL